MITKTNYAVFAFCALMLPEICLASVDSSTPSLSDIINLSVKDEGVDESKLKAISETGVRIGAQGGMISRSKEIIAKTESRAQDLDRIFLFQPLIDSNGLLPPVIVDSEQKIETANGAQRIDFAGVTYKILTPARFVRVAPTWRIYLFAGIGDKRLSVDRIPQAIKPETSAEKAAWEAAVKSGWQIGVEQADSIFKENTARLKRDYIGMIKYLSLRSKGMIRKPVVAETNSYVKVSDDEIAIGVAAKEVEVRSVMESDQGAWGVGQ